MNSHYCRLIRRLVGVSQGFFVVTKDKWIEKVVVKSMQIEIESESDYRNGREIDSNPYMSQMGRKRLKQVKPT